MLIKITQLIRSHIQSWNIDLTVEPMSSTNVECILTLEKQVVQGGVYIFWVIKVSSYEVLLLVTYDEHQKQNTRIQRPWT